MFKTVTIGDCPNCGKQPTVYAVRGKDGAWYHIGCTTVECRVETKPSASFGYVLQNRNSGYALYRMGKRFFANTEKERGFSDMVIEV